MRSRPSQAQPVAVARSRRPGAEAVSSPAAITAGAITAGISQVQSISADTAVSSLPPGGAVAPEASSPRGSSAPSQRQAASPRAAPNPSSSTSPTTPSSAASCRGSECGLRTNTRTARAPPNSPRTRRRLPEQGLVPEASSASVQNCQRPLELRSPLASAVPCVVKSSGGALNLWNRSAGSAAAITPTRAVAATAALRRGPPRRGQPADLPSSSHATAPSRRRGQGARGHPVAVGCARRDSAPRPGRPVARPRRSGPRRRRRRGRRGRRPLPIRDSRTSAASEHDRDGAPRDSVSQIPSSTRGARRRRGTADPTGRRGREMSEQDRREREQGGEPVPVPDRIGQPVGGSGSARRARSRPATPAVGATPGHHRDRPEAHAQAGQPLVPPGRAGRACGQDEEPEVADARTASSKARPWSPAHATEAAAVRIKAASSHRRRRPSGRSEPRATPG